MVFGGRRRSGHDATGTLTISGLSIGPLDIEPPGSGQAIEPAYIDRSVFEQLVAIGAEPQRNTAVWIDASADPDTVSEASSGYDIILDLRERATNFDAVLAGDSRLLWLLAGVGAGSGLLLLVPLISANLRATSRESSVLLALGSSRKPAHLAWRCPHHDAGDDRHSAGRGAHGSYQRRHATRVCDRYRSTPTAVVRRRCYVSGHRPPDRRRGRIAVFPAWAASGPRRTAVFRQSAGADTFAAFPERGWAVGPTLLRPSVQNGVQAAIGVPAGPRQASPWPSLISLTVAATTCIASLTYLAGLDRLHKTHRSSGGTGTPRWRFSPSSRQVALIMERFAGTTGSSR